MGLPFARRKLDAALPELCALLRAGNYLEPACARLKIRKADVNYRLAEGQRDGASKADAEFALEIEAARAEAEIEAVARVQSGAPGWQAAAWWLSHARPARYGDRVQVHVREQVEHVFDVAQKALPAEHYAGLLTALAASGGEAQGTTGDPGRVPN